MKEHAGISKKINEILKEWDPIGLQDYPNDLEKEYLRYIPRVLMCLKSLNSLEELLWQIGEIEIGTHQKHNEEHHALVKCIAQKLYKLSKDYN